MRNTTHPISPKIGNDVHDGANSRACHMLAKRRGLCGVETYMRPPMMSGHPVGFGPASHSLRVSMIDRKEAWAWD